MDDLKELVEKYISLWNCANGTHAKAVSEGLIAHAIIKHKLEDAGIDSRWFSIACNQKLSEEENYNELLKQYSNDAVIKNKDLCLMYIKYLIVTKTVRSSKLKAKSKLAKLISNKDPMLAKYIEYRIRIKKAQDTLSKYLVNETPETLDVRYHEILKDLL